MPISQLNAQRASNIKNIIERSAASAGSIDPQVRLSLGEDRVTLSFGTSQGKAAAGTVGQIVQNNAHVDEAVSLFAMIVRAFSKVGQTLAGESQA